MKKCLNRIFSLYCLHLNSNDKCSLNIFSCMPVITFMVMDKNMAYHGILEGTRISILKKSEKN